MIRLQKDERKRLIGAAGAYKGQGKYAADRGRTVRQFKALGVLLVLSGLAGCAQVISGDTQDIVVQTEPRAGAKCLLQNGRGTWSVLTTPATVTLLRSTTDLSVHCQTDDGWTGGSAASSHMSTLAYVDLTPAGLGTAVDSASGAAYDYPDRLTVTLVAPPVIDDRPHFGAEGGRGIAGPIDLAADRARAADDNVAIRFQTLRVLLDEGLITRDEYGTRRGANLGALLRYSVTPPARDLTRPAPPPKTLVMRLRYLAGAYAEHSISASEQAAERTVILDGLLPSPVLRRADPPPPPAASSATRPPTSSPMPRPPRRKPRWRSCSTLRSPPPTPRRVPRPAWPPGRSPPARSPAPVWRCRPTAARRRPAAPGPGCRRRIRPSSAR